MKSIVYTIRSLSNSGGIERQLVNKANWFVRRGYSITIITEEITECFYKVDSRVKIISLNITKQSSEYLAIRIYRFIIFSIMYGFKISRLLREINPDFVVSTNARDFVVLPFVNRKSKKIYEFHYIVSQISSQKESIIECIIRRLMDYIGNCYEKLVLLTESDMRHNRNVWSNVTVIPNARTFNCDVPAELECNRVIAVGNLFPVKGFCRLIDAWSIVHQRHPDWMLSIYGEGYLRDELQAKIENLHLENVVKLEGRVVDIQKVYLKSSFSLISSYEESFSLTLIEAQTCGLPVIAFDGPLGPSEIITDDVDGYLIQNDDKQAYADKVCLLIENKELRKKLGYNAFNNAKRFMEDKVMAQWVCLFEG